MINIAVVDDEKEITKQIKRIIESRQKDVAIDTYCSGEELLLSGKGYDLLFLDIKMNGRSGIEIAEVIRKKTQETVLIFVTAKKEYVFEAFDVSAFHYLLKPVEEKKLTEVYERAVQEIYRKKSQKEKRLVINNKNRKVILEQKEILYFESRGKKVEIHTLTEVIEVYGAISKLELQMEEGFFRCHRGYLVNLAYITEYDRNSITLKSGEKLLLVKEKYSQFAKTYLRYLRNGGEIFV